MEEFEVLDREDTQTSFTEELVTDFGWLEAINFFEAFLYIYLINTRYQNVLLGIEAVNDGAIIRYSSFDFEFGWSFFLLFFLFLSTLQILKKQYKTAWVFKMVGLCSLFNTMRLSDAYLFHWQIPVQPFIIGLLIFYLLSRTTKRLGLESWEQITKYGLFTIGLIVLVALASDRFPMISYF